MALAALRGSQADEGDRALDGAVEQLLARQRRHRPVRDQATVAQCGPELGILAHDCHRVVELLGARPRLARARRHRGLAVAVQRHVEQQGALAGVVVDRGAHGARGHRLVGRVERLERDGAAPPRRRARRAPSRAEAPPAPPPRAGRDPAPTARSSRAAGRPRERSSRDGRGQVKPRPDLRPINCGTEGGELGRGVITSG